MSSPSLQQLKTPLSWSSELSHIFASLGSQPYKSSSRLQGKKSPFQLSTFANVGVCGEDVSYLVLSFTSEQTRLVWKRHENYLDNSQFPAGSLLENVKRLFFNKTPLFLVKCIFMTHKNVIWFFFFNNLSWEAYTVKGKHSSEGGIILSVNRNIPEC